MAELTSNEWQTIREALVNLKDDVDDDPLEYVDGASTHLFSLLRKMPTTSVFDSKVFLS